MVNRVILLWVVGLISLSCISCLEPFPSVGVVHQPAFGVGRAETHNNGTIVIIGTGPTGLGAAWRLYELGYENFVVIDKESRPGGLARSDIDESGFTWDHGVHVLFSHFEYFDSLMDHAIPPEKWTHHIRHSPAWMRNKYVGYPVQNNLYRLPKDEVVECLDGLLEVYRDRHTYPKPKNFQEWIDQSFGKGLARVFMNPYNFKVWAHYPEEMNSKWVGERVATLNMTKVLSNVIHERDDTTWGPNARFRYPLTGGTGGIWDALYSVLPAEKFQFNRNVVQIDVGAGTEKKIFFDDGSSLAYDHIVSTMPMNVLVGDVLRGASELQPFAPLFKYQSVTMVGFGVDGPLPDVLQGVYWIYYPEEEFVFYRATILSNFSPNMVARPGEQWSLVVEVSESKHRFVNQSTVVEQVKEGLRSAGLLPASEPAHGPGHILSVWHKRLEYGYPVPYLDRDLHVHTIDDALRPLGVWSRGRFGCWKYEVANQDHSTMLGVEAIDNILFGVPELTFRHPDVVNGSQGKGRKIKAPHTPAIARKENGT